MAPQQLEGILCANEQDLQRIRNFFFPLIEDRIITGYNMYVELPPYDKKGLFLNYLHSDLKETYAHFKELYGILRGEGFTKQKISVNNELIDSARISERETDYLTHPEWNDPKSMRYFAFSGRELSFDEAKSSEQDVIGESLQYDWLLKVKDERELRKVIDLFKKYASKFKLDKKGRKIRIGDDFMANEYAIAGSWDVPLLICTSERKPKQLYDFLSIQQCVMPEQIGGLQIWCSTLVRTKAKELQTEMDKRKRDSRFTRKYALRVFIEDYIDLWAKG